jgi:hypothetical protein
MEDKEYKQLALDTLKDSKIITEDDLKSLMELQDELKDIFLYSQIFRTRAEMEFSILNDTQFPTPDSKYWQAVREQNVMFQELVYLSYNYRKAVLEIEDLKRKQKKEKDKIKKDLLQVEIDRKTFDLLNMEKVAKDRIREIKEWHQIKQNLLDKVEYSLEDVDEHQLISYTQRWVRQFLMAGNELNSSERLNLISQLEKGLKVCKEKNLIDKVLPEGSQERKLLKENGVGL